MMFKRLNVMWIVALSTVSLLACAGTMGGPESELSGTVVYLKNNIHGTERIDGDSRSIRASYANYVGDYPNHGMVPVNTRVTIDRVRGNGIYMTSQSDGTEIVFEYNAGNMRGIDAEEYVGLITSPTKVALGSLSAIDRKGIRKGEAYKGMSKDGVRIAWGYPARHRTPSLQENVWTYWRNRFVTIAVEFNGSGKVATIR